MRITDEEVRALCLPSGKDDLLEFDDKLPRFGVRLRRLSTGIQRSFFVQYRFGQKQRRITIGTTEEVNAAKARKAAGDLLAKVRLGIDPKAETEAQHRKLADSFGDMVARYLDAKRSELRPRSFVEVERHLQKAWAPLHKRPMSALSRQELADRLNAIAKESGAVAANRARATLSAFFGWAMKQGLAEANVVLGTEKRDEGSRTRILSDAEIADIWRACSDDHYGAIVKLLLLTGQRRQEVGGMRADELDEQERLWSLPAARTKNGHAHFVPVSDAAMEVIASVPRRAGRGHFFGYGDSPFSGWSKSRRALDQRIAALRAERGAQTPVDPWVLHDLRRTAATRMARLGVKPHVIEAVINHQRSGHQGGIAGVYNLETYLPEKRKALDAWAHHVLGLVSPNVVQFRTKESVPA